MDEWRYQPAKDAGLSAHERTLSLQRESGLVSTITHVAWWLAVRAYLGVYHRLSIEGYENIPAKPPFVLIANHASHLDAIILGAPLPLRLRDRIFPIAAGDVFFEVPVMSIFATGFINALPLWRKNCGPHALKELRQRLVEEPCAYILFPEGGRSRTGEMMRFKPGLGMIIAGTAVPVVPCHISGAFEAMRPDTKIPRPRKISIRAGKPLMFDNVENRREGWEEVATRLDAAVRALKPGG